MMEEATLTSIESELMQPDGASYHFVGLPLEPLQISPECEVSALSEDSACSLFATAYENECGPDEMRRFEKDGVRELSFILVVEGKVHSWCLVQQPPVPKGESPSQSELIEQLLGKHRHPLRATSVVGVGEWERSVVVRATLRALREENVHEFIASDEYSEIFSLNGSVVMAEVRAVDELRLARLYQELGLSERIVFSNGVPESFEFKQKMRSPNHLYQLDLADCQVPPRQQGSVLGAEDIVALAPHLFEIFGEDGEAVTRYSRLGDHQLSTAFYDGETNIAACLVEKSEETIEISAIYVRREWRGRGLGSALLSLSLGLAKNQGVRIALAHVREQNIPSTRLLRSLGFERVETVEDLILLGRLSGSLKTSDLRMLLSKEGIRLR